MNRWLLIRRLRAPAFLILFGILALLNQWGIFSFRRSWPLFLILAGLLLLAERASLAGPLPPDANPAGWVPRPSSATAGSYGSTGPAAGVNAPAPTSEPSSDVSSPDASSSGEAENASRGAWRP